MSDRAQWYVYGAGGHSHVVIDVMRDQGVEVRGVFDDHPSRWHRLHRDVRPGIRMAGAAFPTLDAPVILCVGRNSERAELAHLLHAEFGTAVHSSATIAGSVVIGEGTVVLHRAVIQPNSVIGRHVLINTAASVDHDNVIADFVHISPHVTLCGHVEVGEGTHIGAGATVIPGVKIGAWTTVGAGAVVLKDLPDHVTAVGNPARIVPNRSGQTVPQLEPIDLDADRRTAVPLGQR